MILKMRHIVKRDCHIFGMRERTGFAGPKKSDGDRSVAATNIYCQGYEVAHSKVDRYHRGSIGTDRVCIVQKRDERSRISTQTQT